MADTDLQQLVINVGTTQQIQDGISGGTITQDMLSITTDGPEYATTSDIKDATLTITQNGTTVGTFSANASSNATVNLTDTKTTMTYTALTETLTWS